MNSDAGNQTYGFIVTKSFHVLYLICSSLEFCGSVRLTFISIIQGRNCDSEKLTSITLQACHGVFFLTNSPVLFTLCCQYQTIGKYSTARTPKLCLKIQHCSQIVHDSWKDETIWGSSLDSTPGLLRPTLRLMCISWLLWTKDIVFLISNAPYFVTVSLHFQHFLNCS